jgi:hypothetical protein
MRSLRVFGVSLLAVATSAMFASSASAATVTLATSAINVLSNGSTTFSSSLGTIACTFTLRGTLATSIAAPLGTTTRIGSITGVTGGPLFPCVSNTGVTAVSFGSFPYALNETLTNNITATVRHVIVLIFLGGFCSSTYSGDIAGDTSIAGGTSSVINTTISSFANLSGTATAGGLCPTGTLSGSLATTAIGTRIIR